MARIVPDISTVQGRLGRKCLDCGETFLIKSSSEKIEHDCPSIPIFHELDLDMGIKDEVENSHNL